MIDSNVLFLIMIIVLNGSQTWFQLSSLSFALLHKWALFIKVYVFKNKYLEFKHFIRIINKINNINIEKSSELKLNINYLLLY